MGWGDFRSCKVLLDRVEKNDPTLKSLNILPMKEFGDAELKRLGTIITSCKNTHLISLYASGHKVSNEALKEFGNALAFASRKNALFLTELAFGCKEMGDEGLMAFAQGLKEIQCDKIKIQKLDLSSKGLTAKSWKTLLQTFFSNSNDSSSLVSNLNVADNDFLGLSKLGEVDTYSLERLNVLNMARCNLRPEDLRQMCSIVGESRGKVSLELILSGNTEIGSDMQDIAQLMSENCDKITALKIDGCGICNNGLQNLLNSGIGKQLRCFDLSNNEFNSAEVVEILGKLLAQGHVKDINLSQNKLSDDAAKILASNIIQGNGNLEYLDLAQTNLSSENAIQFLKIPNLKYLRLFDNNLGEGSFFSNPELINILAENVCLETLDLCGNKATDLSLFLNRLLRLYKTEPRHVISVLELGGNPITEADELIINELKSLGVDIARDRPKTVQS